MAQGFNKEIDYVSQNLMRSTGLSYKPQNGYAYIGTDSEGRKLYGNLEKINDNDTTAGTKFTNSFKESLIPFGVLGNEDASWLDKVAGISGDTAFIASLGLQAQKRDAKGFVSTLVSKYGKNIAAQITDDKQAQTGINAGLTAYNLYNNWNNLSSAQKAIGIANVGIQANTALTGLNLAKKTIPGSESLYSGKGVTVGQALGLANFGINGYSLAKNWSQIDTIGRIIYGAGTVSQGAQLARTFGLLGSGTNGAVVPGVSVSSLAQSGFKPSPAQGVGAIVGPGNSVPQGYKAVATGSDGNVIAVPEGLESTASTSGFDNTLNNISGGVALAAGAYGVYQGWKNKGVQGGLQAIAGGSSMAAGVATLTQTNPALFGGVVSASMLSGVAAGAGAAGSAYGILSSDMSGEDKARGLRQTGENAVLDYTTFGGTALARAVDDSTGGNVQKVRDVIDKTNPVNLAQDYVAGKVLNAFGSGKNADQKGRDSIRSSLIKSGFLNEDYTYNLADGSVKDLGLDGRSESRDFKYADKAVKKQSLRSYDVDYTNDMDFFSGIGGIALSRLSFGSKDRNVEQIGGQLGNAALGNVGYGADMTQNNFSAVMQNLRGMYAKKGISSKKDAYELANQGFAEGRWNESDLISMQQVFNMVFDDDYNTASKLSQGRWKGIEVAHERPVGNPSESKVPVEKPKERIPVETFESPAPKTIPQSNDIGVIA